MPTLQSQVVVHSVASLIAAALSRGGQSQEEEAEEAEATWRRGLEHTYRALVRLEAQLIQTCDEASVFEANYTAVRDVAGRIPAGRRPRGAEWFGNGLQWGREEDGGRTSGSLPTRWSGRTPVRPACLPDRPRPVQPLQIGGPSPAFAS